MATVTDEIIDLHDRILGKLLFNAAKNKHQQQFQAWKAINAKVRLYGRIGSGADRRHNQAAMRLPPSRRHILDSFCRERHRGAEAPRNR